MSSIARNGVTAVEEFKDKVQARTARVGIIGLGYVGQPLALLFNEESFPVTGFDIDATKVDTLNAGGSYIRNLTGCSTAKVFVSKSTHD